jgi:hypothetical protein
MPVPVKIVLGLMALWGTVYAFAALGGEFALSPPPGSGHVTPSGLEAFVIHLHAANALAIFLIEAAIALGLQSMRVGHRVTWVFAMMFFYPLAVPAFWYLHIWRGAARGAPPSAATPDGAFPRPPDRR